jgi:hypothetical protein
MRQSTSLSRSPSPSPRMNLRSARYYTAKEARAGAFDNTDDETDDDDDDSTLSFDISEPGFEESEGDDFDPILGGDYNAADDNMDVN